MPKRAKCVAIALLLIVSIINAAIAETTEQFDFRNTRWGMTKAEILASESGIESNSVHSDTLFLYEAKVASRYTANVLFHLNEDGLLYEGVYMLSPYIDGVNCTISDYDALKEQLANKYGAQQSEYEFWEDETYRDSPDIALAKGHLAYTAIFHLGDTSVTLYLSGYADKTSISISYASIPLKKIADDKARIAWVEANPPIPPVDGSNL